MPSKEIKINDTVWYKAKNGKPVRATVIGLSYVVKVEGRKSQSIHADNIYTSPTEIPGAHLDIKQLTLDDVREKSFIKSMCDLVKKYMQGEE